MSTIRALSKHTRTLSRTVTAAPKPMTARAFHSPFTLLSSSPSSSPPPPESKVSPLFYEKQVDDYSEPHYSSSGQRTYVVSEPDPSDTPYQVPSGAYPTSAPYINYTPTSAPTPRQRSSTSSSFAHPYASRAASKTEPNQSASRNPQPDDVKVAEKFSALGVDKAWETRK